MTKQEYKIASLITEIDTITKRMNALMPMHIESEGIGKWVELKAKKENLTDLLNQEVDAYIKSSAETNKELINVYFSNTNCTTALQILQNAHREGRLTDDEYGKISRPIVEEIESTRRYAIHKLAEKNCPQKGKTKR